MIILEQGNMAVFEHRFWLQILGDHSRFIFSSLSPDEVEEIRKASHFMQLFDTLLIKSREELSEDELNQLTMSSYKAAQDIRAFKLHIIRRHLTGKIMINLSSTFINHMVNEVEEYIRNLHLIMQSALPFAHPVHHHQLWLPDGSGHASSLSGMLDMSEKQLIDKSRQFTVNFDRLYLKAIEFMGYMRTGLTQFPALNRLNSEAESEMDLFKKFLKELEELVREKKVLGTLQPLMLDHMYREECYYLTRLSMVSDVKSPECDPTKPREE